MWIFDAKKEEKRRTFRFVVVGHVIDASSLPTYSSVVQNLSITLVLLIAKSNNLNISTGDVGNACVNANVGESVYSWAVEEWGDESGCALKILKALCGLKTSASQ